MKRIVCWFRGHVLVNLYVRKVTGIEIGGTAECMRCPARLYKRGPIRLAAVPSESGPYDDACELGMRDVERELSIAGMPVWRRAWERLR